MKPIPELEAGVGVGAHRLYVPVFGATPGGTGGTEGALRFRTRVTPEALE
jgi:hypothetical protein